MDVILLLIIYFIVVNIVGFAIMGIDKRRAQKHVFRIPEATLFIIAIIGGSLGAILGMYSFRHKTRHWYFVYGLPLILILQCICFYLISQLPLDFTIL